MYNMSRQLPCEEGKYLAFCLVVLDVQVTFLMMFISGSIKQLTPPRGDKDVIFTLVVADGRVGPFFYVTRNRNVPKNLLKPEEGKILVLPNMRRRGERMMEAYLEWAIARGVLEVGDICLTDNESSLKTQLVEQMFNDGGIQHMCFPTNLGSFMNPCDNSFHSVFKHYYYTSLIGYTHVDTPTKIRLAYNAYQKVKEKSIVHMFKHVGILGKNKKRALIRLFTEGIQPISRWKEVHQKQLQRYLDFIGKHTKTTL
jgi:GNAT superfamily N-acetyltransferase